MATIAQKVREAKRKWKAAREQAGDGTFAEYSDGRYLARLTGLSLGTAQSSGRLQTTFEWTFADGEYKGNKAYNYQGMDNEEGLIWLVRDLQKFGYEVPEDMDELEELLAEILKDRPLARIQLVSSGEYQNIRINRVFTDGEEPEVDDGEEGEGESEEELGAPDSDDKGGKTWGEGQACEALYEGETYKVVIVSIDEDEGTATVQNLEDEDDQWDCDLDELKESEEEGEEEGENKPDPDEDGEGEEVTFSLNDTVVGKLKGKTIRGTLMDIDEDGEFVIIKDEAGKTFNGIPVDTLAVAEKEETKPRKVVRRTGSKK
jgi:hypothetical protein